LRPNNPGADEVICVLKPLRAGKFGVLATLRMTDA
jgi:hypothetical protein